jgi:hypothetical protein
MSVGNVNMSGNAAGHVAAEVHARLSTTLKTQTQNLIRTSGAGPAAPASDILSNKRANFVSWMCDSVRPTFVGWFSATPVDPHIPVVATDPIRRPHGMHQSLERGRLASGHVTNGANTLNARLEIANRLGEEQLIRRQRGSHSNVGNFGSSQSNRFRSRGQSSNTDAAVAEVQRCG